MAHAKPFTNPLAAEKEERQITREENNAKVDWRALMAQDHDFMKGLIQEVIQQVLEAEMEEARQAGNSERTGERLGCRSGHYVRGMMTRVGKIELRVPPRSAGPFRQEVFE